MIGLPIYINLIPKSLALMIINMGNRERDERRSLSIERRAGECGITFMALLLIIFALCSSFVDGFSEYTVNVILKTVQQVQLWRVSTSFLIPGFQLALLPNQLIFFSCLQFVMCLYFLAKVSWLVERTYSTAYFVMNCFLQAVFCNIVFVVIYYPLIYFELIEPFMFVYGTMPLILNFLFQTLSINDKTTTKILCFDCQFNYYLILVFFMITILIIQGFFLYIPVSPYFICLFLSFSQYIIRKQPFCKLPISVYKAFDCLVPSAIYESNRYTKVINVEEDLNEICLKWCCKCCDKQQHSQELLRNEDPGQEKRRQSEMKLEEYWRNKYPQVQQRTEEVQMEVKQQNYEGLASQPKSPHGKRNDNRQKAYWKSQKIDLPQTQKQLRNQSSSKAVDIDDHPSNNILISQNIQLRSEVMDQPEKKTEILDYRQFWVNKSQINTKVSHQAQLQENKIKQKTKQHQQDANDDDFI